MTRVIFTDIAYSLYKNPDWCNRHFSIGCLYPSKCKRNESETVGRLGSVVFQYIGLLHYHRLALPTATRMGRFRLLLERLADHSLLGVAWFLPMSDWLIPELQTRIYSRSIRTRQDGAFVRLCLDPASPWGGRSLYFVGPSMVSRHKTTICAKSRDSSAAIINRNVFWDACLQYVSYAGGK